MGILLGLVTALTWGGADFVARSSTHRIGTLRTMFYMQFTGFLLLTISMRWLGGWRKFDAFRARHCKKTREIS